MAKVVARAVRTRQRALADDVAVPYGALVLRLSRRGQQADRGDGPPPTRHPQRPSPPRRAVRGPAAGRPGPPDPADPRGGRPGLGDGLPRLRGPRRAGGRRVRPRGLHPQGEAGARDGRGPGPDVAPTLTPRAAPRPVRGTPAHRRRRPRGPRPPRSSTSCTGRGRGSFEEVAWTPADAALVDEARALLGPRGGNADDGVRKYGHIVVDEVQDLSPMQLRMLTRRSLSGSMTVVGDIAQATAPWAPTRWEDITDHLPRRRPVPDGRADVSYRTPAEVLAVASRVLAVAAPELTPPTPVRRTEVEPRMIAGPRPRRRCEPGRHGRRSGPQGGRGGRGGGGGGDPGAGRHPGSRDAAPRPGRGPGHRRAARWWMPGTCARGACPSRSSSWPADAANGLEFDSVVVVEPGVIAGETARGLRTLYVALTRPTQRLSVVHLAPLPAALDGR